MTEEEKLKKIKEQLEKARAIFNGGFLPTSIWSDIDFLLSVIRFEGVFEYLTEFIEECQEEGRFIPIKLISCSTFADAVGEYFKWGEVK